MYRDESGFTLIELMIVIVVIGILATLAVPKYMTVTRKAKESEAKMVLSQLHSLQEAYYRENDTYATTLEDLGFEQEKLISEGGKARYKVTLLSGDAKTYSAIATSTVDYDADGVYSVWKVSNDGKIENITPD
ncbi:MAG TPA: type IV pilin protein [Candidatus Cloacimonadota bacterium]|nr:type IV pilin protein [Candidatus Cloacimonadota bacterium]